MEWFQNEGGTSDADSNDSCRRCGSSRLCRSYFYCMAEWQKIRKRKGQDSKQLSCLFFVIRFA